MKFVVSDTGVGIPKEKINDLFSRFTQLDSSKTKEYAGTGLGLSICKLLVELMNGEICVTSTENKGSTFIFTIPFTIQQSSETKEIDCPDSSFPKNFGTVKILVVDDSEENQVLIEHYLKDNQFILEKANNGLEAFEKFGQSKYDIVLMDIQMPILDGLEATKKIRLLEKENKSSPTPILALSAYALQEEKEQSLQAGCDDHVTKPIKKKELLDIIFKNISKQRKS